MVLLIGSATLYGSYRQGSLHDLARAITHRMRAARQQHYEAPPRTAHETVAITIDENAYRHPISPYIYGMAFAPKDYLLDLRIGCNRWGGNDKTRYNWVHGNACSAARDWRWANRSAVDGKLVPGPSSAADRFVEQNRDSGCATLLTIPTIGWVARDADTRNRSERVPEHGGSPLTSAESAIAGYDPADNRERTSIRSAARKQMPFAEHPTMLGSTIYQDEWAHHLIQKFGTALTKGVHFYAMDNEPDLWDLTHTDVHPARMGYDDMLSNFLEYATAIKSVDPTAQITGPVVSGWTGYQFSALDRGDDNFRTHADQSRHGGEPFLLWFLKQVRAYDHQQGKRTLNVLDVHYYPQGQGIYGADLSPDTQTRRLRCTRSLWDSTYNDESWIDGPVQLIPRLKAWIAAGYPGTKIGITEWNFGADNSINGALAIVDVLGIYGREDVTLANYWAYPPKGSPGYLAFKLYRNADEHGHGFGDISCQAISANPDWVSCFAADDTQMHCLTTILVNKMPVTTVTAQIRVINGHRAYCAAQTWRLEVEHPGAIETQQGLPVQKGQVTVSLSPYSITLVRFNN